MMQAIQKMDNEIFFKNLKAAALATIPALLFVILYHFVKPAGAPVAWRSPLLEFLLILVIPVVLLRTNWDRKIESHSDRVFWCLLVGGTFSIFWWLIFGLGMAILLTLVH